MPHVTLSVCVECEQTFIVHEYDMLECGFISNMNDKNIKEPKTWNDWLMHLSTHCPLHRLEEIPMSCQEDAERARRKAKLY